MPTLPSASCWGQVLHRDVQDLHAGYVDFVNAAAFSLFGVRMVSMRYPLALLTVIQAALMFLILKRGGVVDRLDWRSGAYLAQFRSVSESNRQLVRLVSRSHDHCLALVESVGLRWRHVVTGFLVGTAFLFRQLSGVFLASGVLVFLLLEKPRCWSDGRARLARAMLALIAVGHSWYVLRVTDPVGWVAFRRVAPRSFAVGLAANEAIQPGGARAPA